MSLKETHHEENIHLIDQPAFFFWGKPPGEGQSYRDKSDVTQLGEPIFFHVVSNLPGGTGQLSSPAKPR